GRLAGLPDDLVDAGRKLGGAVRPVEKAVSDSLHLGNARRDHGFVKRQILEEFDGARAMGERAQAEGVETDVKGVYIFKDLFMVEPPGQDQVAEPKPLLLALKPSVLPASARHHKGA